MAASKLKQRGIVVVAQPKADLRKHEDRFGFVHKNIPEQTIDVVGASYSNPMPAYPGDQIDHLGWYRAKMKELDENRTAPILPLPRVPTLSEKIRYGFSAYFGLK